MVYSQDSDEYPGTEVDRETLEQQWNQAEEQDGLNPASECSRGHLARLNRSGSASAFAPSQPQTVRPGPSAPLPQAPDLQISSSPAEPALVSSDVDTLERALAAPIGNQRGKLAASRRSRGSGWGKRTADSKVDELNAMREDSSVTSSADVMKGFMRVRASVALKPILKVCAAYQFLPASQQLMVVLAQPMLSLRS